MDFVLVRGGRLEEEEEEEEEEQEEVENANEEEGKKDEEEVEERARAQPRREDDAQAQGARRIIFREQEYFVREYYRLRQFKFIKLCVCSAALCSGTPRHYIVY